MVIKIYEDVDKLSLDVAKSITDFVKEKPNAILGLATGSSPEKVYEIIAREEVSFREVVTFNLDEYIGISENHPQSYRYYMNNKLFSKIDIQLENTHLPNTKLENASQEYDKLLDLNPRDIQLLGIGRNGHIAFNEPSSYFSSNTHITPLTSDTINSNSRLFKEGEYQPTEAITMGIAQIFSAKKIFLIAFGEDKQKAVEEMLLGEIDPMLPASILRLHSDITLFLDKKAISERLNKKLVEKNL